jgi:hypothetical protein
MPTMSALGILKTLQVLLGGGSGGRGRGEAVEKVHAVNGLQYYYFISTSSCHH